MKETVRFGVILFLICLVASSALAWVNKLTYPRIMSLKILEENKGLLEVLPDAVFEEIKDKEQVLYYKGLGKQNKLLGYVIKTKVRGYASDIEAFVSLDKDFKILNIKILSQKETPGLGSRISESSFLTQFKDKGLEDLDKVEAITGATISSGAVINSVKEKIAEFNGK